MEVRGVKRWQLYSTEWIAAGKGCRMDPTAYLIDLERQISCPERESNCYSSGRWGRRLVIMPSPLPRMLPGCMFMLHALCYIYKICGMYSHPPIYVISTYVVPQLRPLPLAQHSQVRQFVHTVLWRVSSSCWIPMIRSCHSTIFLRVGSKEPLKKLSKLCLSLRRGLWKFQSWIREAWTEAGTKVFEGTGRNEKRAATGQGIMRMLACYENLKEKKRSVSHQTSVSLRHLRICA